MFFKVMILDLLDRSYFCCLWVLGEGSRVEEKGCGHKIQAKMYIYKGFIDWVIFDYRQHFSSVNERNYRIEIIN